MGAMRKSPEGEYCLIIPGKGYSSRADHARDYKTLIKGIGSKRITEPFGGAVEIKLEYLYLHRADRLDGDNLLKTICDALKGVAYKDDSQIVHYEVDTININSSFAISPVPNVQQVADLLTSGSPFTIIDYVR